MKKFVNLLFIIIVACTVTIWSIYPTLNFEGKRIFLTADYSVLLVLTLVCSKYGKHSPALISALFALITAAVEIFWITTLHTITIEELVVEYEHVLVFGAHGWQWYIVYTLILPATCIVIGDWMNKNLKKDLKAVA
jgi:hypothetical protein